LPFLLDFLKKNKLQQVILYGTATGCQLAIAFALAYPEKVALLVGENACHFEDHEREELYKNYFPNLEPRPDGSHLPKIWEMCRKTSIGFPWTSVPDGEPLPPNFPLATIAGMVRDTLLAGENYHLAYRAAFDHERAEKVQGLAVPANFIIWQGSILRDFMERLASFPMPENVRFLRCGGDIATRYEMVKSVMLTI
jgi:pimeloyl-ACP methyl ester carboxylesterase